MHLNYTSKNKIHYFLNVSFRGFFFERDDTVSLRFYVIDILIMDQAKSL